MTRYIVHTKQVYDVRYAVNADSPDDAISKLLGGAHGAVIDAVPGDFVGPDYNTSVEEDEDAMAIDTNDGEPMDGEQLRQERARVMAEAMAEYSSNDIRTLSAADDWMREALVAHDALIAAGHAFADRR